MEVYALPHDFTAPSQSTDAVLLMKYESRNSSARSRVSLSQNLFSFLMEGHKEIVASQQNIGIDASQFVLLAAGNCLMTEKTVAETGRYKSILLFFDNSALHNFFTKYPGILPAANTAATEPAVVFEKDAFLFNFIHSLDLSLASGKFARELALLKFEELMLHLCGHYPQQVMRLQTTASNSSEDMAFKSMIEKHVEQNITVEELAFLCNTSVSTFKRRFTKLYGSSPNRWMLRRRMELAASLLQQQVKPSEVYYQVGYENFSSFIQSFKQTYGLTPGEYQEQKLNVYL